jgi:hypothetical protein
MTRGKWKGRGKGKKEGGKGITTALAQFNIYNAPTG